MLTVTVVDSETGETQTATIGPGNYVVLCVEPCHRASVQTYANGTHVITVKGYGPLPTPTPKES